MSPDQYERQLTELFDAVEAPPGLDAWRDRVAPEPESSHRWGPVLAAAAAVVVLGAGVVVAVLASRLPPTEPQPDPPTTTVAVSTTSATSSAPPSSGSVPPSAASTLSTVPPVGSQPPGLPGGPGVPGGGAPQPPGVTSAPPRTGTAPVGWPAPGNIGVLPGTTLRSHTGDLRITTPGAVISDLRVDGTIWVDAADVTLRGVLVVPRSGVGIHQRASRLTIEDSTVSASYSVTHGVLQAAPGLTVRRVEVSGARTSIGLTSDSSVVDSYLAHTVDVVGSSSRILLRHNALDGVVLDDNAGAITDVTIENNRFGDRSDVSGTAVSAPIESGSRDVRVRDNKIFHALRPSVGWNAQRPGFVWTGNTDLESGAAVGP